MANYVQDDEGQATGGNTVAEQQETYPDIVEWLTRNKLRGKNDFVLNIFEEEDMTMEELIAMDKETLNKYLKLVLKGDDGRMQFRIQSRVKPDVDKL